MDASFSLALLGFMVACLPAAMTGAFFRPGEWYEGLKKPSWRPPNRLFAPVWTVLYVMIAFSGWLVWREAGFAGAALPLAVYALQLVLNAVWTPLFFGWHRADLGFVDIVLVWLSIIATVALFRPIHVTGRSSTARGLADPMGDRVPEEAGRCDLRRSFVVLSDRVQGRAICNNEATVPPPEDRVVLPLGKKLAYPRPRGADHIGKRGRGGLTSLQVQQSPGKPH